jgi:hypothetical protein
VRRDDPSHTVPAFVAALALIGLVVLMVVEHRLNKPVAKNETMIQSGTTDASAAAAGATVAPTERSCSLLLSQASLGLRLQAQIGRVLGVPKLP